MDNYVDGIGRGKYIHLAVGGYIKGESAESVQGRKHELYSLPSGFNENFPEMEELVKCASVEIKKILDKSIWILGKNLKKEDSANGQEESNFITKQFQPLAGQIYFNNSENLMHETLRNLDFNKIQEYKKQFSDLAEKAFKEVTQPYEHDPKLLKAIECSREHLIRELNKLLVGGRRNAA